MTPDKEALTERQHLLTILGEECNEVAQRVCKALRFGLHEVQPGQIQNNEQRIAYELYDLLGTVQRLQSLGVLSNFPDDMEAVAEKADKIEYFIQYARDIGMIREGADHVCVEWNKDNFCVGCGLLPCDGNPAPGSNPPGSE